MQLSSDSKRRLALLAALDVVLAISFWVVGLYFLAVVFVVLLIAVAILLVVSRIHRTDNSHID